MANRLPSGFAPVDVGGDLFEEGQELGLGVEDVDHHVAALVTIGVVGVVPHDKSTDAVVLDIDPAHRRKTKAAPQRGPRNWPRPDMAGLAPERPTRKLNLPE